MQLFNADKTGVHVVHKQGKVLAQLGQCHVYSVTSAEKGKTHTHTQSVVVCISCWSSPASHDCVSTKTRVLDSLKDDCVPNTYFANSSGEYDGVC